MDFKIKWKRNIKASCIFWEMLISFALLSRRLMAYLYLGRFYPTKTATRLLGHLNAILSQERKLMKFWSLFLVIFCWFFKYHFRYDLPYRWKGMTNKSWANSAVKSKIRKLDHWAKTPANVGEFEDFYAIFVSIETLVVRPFPEQGHRICLFCYSWLFQVHFSWRFQMLMSQMSIWNIGYFEKFIIHLLGPISVIVHWSGCIIEAGT